MPKCLGCASEIVKPFIACEDCRPVTVCVCLACFGKGFETDTHQSDHRYEVIKDDFVLFESCWSAAEELRLLEAISEFGFGNWTEIANHLGTKSAKDCEFHYCKHYINDSESPLPEFKSPDFTYFPCHIPFRASDDPPRPAEGSALQKDMAGYSAARGDFAVEHNDYAELDIKDMEFSDCDDAVEKQLKLAVLDIYRNIIKERQRRKKIVMKFGLINMTKNLLHTHPYECSLGLQAVTRLKTLSHLVTPQKWDFVLEALHWSTLLKQQISQLKKYRENGLKTFRSAAIYDRLSERRSENERKLHMLNDILQYIQDDYQCQPWTQRRMVFDTLSKNFDINLPNPPRRTAPSLDVAGLPGFDRLTEAEVELCSKVRLVPNSYLEFKRILMSECSKQGQLRLAQARSLIKIDVNKTRKIYDFLLSQNLIHFEDLDSKPSKQRKGPTKTSVSSESTV